MLADPILHHDHDAVHMTARILTSKLEIPMSIHELRAVAARPRRVRGDRRAVDCPGARFRRRARPDRHPPVRGCIAEPLANAVIDVRAPVQRFNGDGGYADARRYVSPSDASPRRSALSRTKVRSSSPTTTLTDHISCPLASVAMLGTGKRTAVDKLDEAFGDQQVEQFFPVRSMKVI